MRAIFAAAVLIAACVPAAARSNPACHETPGTYVNVSGNVVHRPECVTAHQAGETAICRDGSHSFSQHHTGTCSHHGGVAQWE